MPRPKQMQMVACRMPAPDIARINRMADVRCERPATVIRNALLDGLARLERQTPQQRQRRRAA